MIITSNKMPKRAGNMTLRDYFAGQCISIALKAALETAEPAMNLEWAVQCAYETADAMLAYPPKATRDGEGV